MSREQEIRDAVERFLTRSRQQIDGELETLASDLMRIVQGDMRTSRTDVERAAIEVARAVAKGGTHARHNLIARVVVAIRRLDDASTLRGILDALADGVSADASRAAVLLADGETLRTYRHHGFPAGAGPQDLPIDASALLTGAVRLRQNTFVPAAATPPDPRVPAFLRVAKGQVGLLMPLVVSSQVVALVYVEGGERRTDEPGAPVWTEHAEVLVRHASSRLESVTSSRTVEVLTNPA